MGSKVKVTKTFSGVSISINDQFAVDFSLVLKSNTFPRLIFYYANVCGWLRH